MVRECWWYRGGRRIASFSGHCSAIGSALTFSPAKVPGAKARRAAPTKLLLDPSARDVLLQADARKASGYKR